MNEPFEDIDFVHEDGRSVPVRIYKASGPTRAWILFSVGFGGSRLGYGFLARHWAEAGFSTVVVEHVGSNLDVLKSLPQKRREDRNREVVRRVSEPAELVARPADLHLVYRELRSRFEGLPLGLGGHSFGSYTILAAAGLEAIPAHHGLSGLSSSGLLVISPQPPGMLFEESEYGELDSPTLLLTGTEDHLLSGDASYIERKKVYEYLPQEHRHMIILEGVEHMTFAGVGLNLGPQLEQIKTVSLRWWEGVFGELVGWSAGLEDLVAECLS